MGAKLRVLMAKVGAMWAKEIMKSLDYNPQNNSKYPWVHTDIDMKWGNEQFSFMVEFQWMTVEGWWIEGSRK